jgi:hypothetical protein
MEKNKNFILKRKPRNQELAYMRLVGDSMVREIREEAIRAGGLFNAVPKSKRFLDSFGYKIDRDKIIIYSTWEYIKPYLEGRKPYQMWWAKTPTHSKRQAVPIRQKDGSIEFRALPMTTQKAWIHPAIKKWTWIEKGAERGKMQAEVEVMAKIAIERIKRASIK